MNVEVEMSTETFLDKTIDEIAKEAVPRISVLGIGGGGCNIVSWMKDGIKGAKVLAINSDAQHLSVIKAGEKLLLGYKTTGGLGCGGFPDQGTLAAEESALEIERAIGDSDLGILTTTLGGGTGTGATPVIARITKELGTLTIGVVTIPLDVEGIRLTQAKEGLKSLVDICDSVIVIDNNSLRKVAGKLPLKDAFGVANERLGAFIKNISEALSVPGLVNLDFADMKAIMKEGGVCAVGFGEGSGDMKVEEAAEKALDSQLLDIGDIRKAKGVLVHIEGGEDMTLEDINRAGELVLKKVSPSARVAWGARVNPELDGILRATVVLAGVESPFLARAKKRVKPPAKKKPAKFTHARTNEAHEKPVAKKAPAKPATKKKSTKRTAKKNKGKSSARESKSKS